MLRIADKILKLSIVDVCEIGLGYDPCEYVKNIRIKALLNSFDYNIHYTYTQDTHIPFQYTLRMGGPTLFAISKEWQEKESIIYIYFAQKQIRNCLKICINFLTLSGYEGGLRTCDP